MADSPFPDVRWGSESSILREPLTAFASTRPGSWVIKTLTPLDRFLLERTGGRFTILGPVAAPVVLLTTTGRKSGAPRTTPLLYHREGEQIFVVGSNFGQEQHPAWTSNLLADPHAIVAIGGTMIPVTATLLEEPERTRIYQAFERYLRVYGVYEHRTDREIRVFALTAE
ncbi:nitroreductase [Rhodococcus sp. WMMA185]|uniref:nitroreductase/quinone reductase family protein n=1 Tax=Rhodococcus sp. WMMA185 TaxID=679318 RepID=UPI0008791D30|nr:nitroreductase/quinone reductase family protein [Rhodococcus sp. WMMA185]AOW93297.1 nitroreductase [Rhodococcus sp. WMMA185]